MPSHTPASSSNSVAVRRVSVPIGDDHVPGIDSDFYLPAVSCLPSLSRKLSAVFDATRTLSRMSSVTIPPPSAICGNTASEGAARSASAMRKVAAPVDEAEYLARWLASLGLGQSCRRLAGRSVLRGGRRSGRRSLSRSVETPLFTLGSPFRARPSHRFRRHFSSTSSPPCATLPPV